MDNNKKRGRGRPRKHHVIETETYVNKDMQRAVGSKSKTKAVDQHYLFEHVMQYLVKMQVTHNALYQEEGQRKPIYRRLLDLDIQMIDICRAVLDPPKS